jgi:enediyne biosynthesis protein E4
LCLLLFLLTSCGTGGFNFKNWFSEKEKNEKKSKSNKYRLGPLRKKSGYFKDVTAKYGLPGIKATHIYAVDFNSDGWTDLVVLPEFFSRPEFYYFSPRKKKFLRLWYSPFKKNMKASFLNFVDFDNDGIMDVIVGVLNQKTEITKSPLIIFRGYLKKKKLSYGRAFTFPGKPRPISSATVLDYNLDGKLDLFVSNWYGPGKYGPAITPDQLFFGEGFRFKDVSGALKEENKRDGREGPYVNAKPTYGALNCDIDGNHYPDILTVSSDGFANKVWMNVYNKKLRARSFENAGNISNFGADSQGDYDLRGGGRTFGLDCIDYNGDGIMDTFLGELSHSYDNENRDRSSILTGSRRKFPPKFVRTQYYDDQGLTNWSQGDRRGTFFDYNFDGLVDLIVDNTGFPPKSRLVLFEQEKNHAFKDIAVRAGIDILNPSGTVIMDFNKDGKPDIVTGQTSIRAGNIKRSIYLFENQLPRKRRRSLRFFPKGVWSNAAGIGARIVLKTNKRVQTKYVHYSHGGLPSQNERGVFFGLSKNEKVVFAKVYWPYKKKGKPFVRKYKLSKLKFKKFLNLTLCEIGDAKKGRFAKCPKK